MIITHEIKFLLLLILIIAISFIVNNIIQKYYNNNYNGSFQSNKLSDKKIEFDYSINNDIFKTLLKKTMIKKILNTYELDFEKSDIMLNELKPFIESDIISFPYKKLFIESDDKFKQLCAYKSKEIIYRFDDKYYNYFTRDDSIKNNLSLLFDNKYLAVDVCDSYSIDVLTDLYQEKERVKCNVIGKQSPMNYWKKNYEYLINELLKRKQIVNSENLRELIYDKCFECTLFKCTYAAHMMQKFSSTKILDFSAGWGDRLFGALASKLVTKYVAFDPNINLKPGHDEIIANYNTNNKIIDIKYIPFEQAIFTSNDKFDLIFTSPPYFNFENYISDNQSCKTFSTYESWLHDFLFVSLKKAWNVLETNGYMMIHIANVKIYEPKYTVYNIIEDMNNYIHSFDNAIFKGSLGIIGRTSGVDKMRPCWIWYKCV